MNLSEINAIKELFVEPAIGSPGEFYINVSSEAFAPAIATVFNNRYADVSEEDSVINASYFSALPEFIKVHQKAMAITEVVPGRSTKRDLTEELRELQELCESVIKKISQT